jgi:hypothetical protein
MRRVDRVAIVVVMLQLAAGVASAADNSGWSRGPNRRQTSSPTLASRAVAVSTAQLQDTAEPDAAADVLPSAEPSTDTAETAPPPDEPSSPQSTTSPSSTAEPLPPGSFVEGAEEGYLEHRPVPRADGAPDCGPLCRLQCAPFVIPYPSGLTAGFEAVLAKPYFATNSAPRFGAAQTTLAEKWEFDMAPRAWLGYTLPGGMGGRFRYWQFDHRSVQQTIALPGSEQQLQSRLALQTFDLEWTQRAQTGRMVFNFAAGLRYATIDHASHNQFTLITAPPFETASAHFVQEFHGGGPTLAVEMWRPFLSKFAFYGIARGSILFGNRFEQGLSNINDVNFDVQNRHESLLPIGELQLGTQWSEPIGRGVFFVRTGIEAQVWGDAGNITAGSSVNGELFTASNLGFFGLTTAVGFAW